MGCTRQTMHHVAIQRSDELRAKFMSVYDPSMLIWLDETGCDGCNTIRKYGYSIRGLPLSDHRLLVRGVRYTAIPIVSTEGIHDVYLRQGTMDGDHFTTFLRNCLLPVLQPFNWVNPRSVVILDNASIHHVKDLVETQAGSKLFYLPPYSPDLNPAEGVFSQLKSIMKSNDKLFQACSAPRGLIAMADHNTRLYWTHTQQWIHNLVFTCSVVYTYCPLSFFRTSSIAFLSALYSLSFSIPDSFKLFNSANCL